MRFLGGGSIRLDGENVTDCPFSDKLLGPGV